MAMPNWISVNPEGGGTGSTTVSVEASGNISTSARSGTLTVKTASGLTKTVSLSQGGRSTPIYIIVGGTGGYLTKFVIDENGAAPVVWYPVISGSESCIGCGNCSSNLSKCPGNCFTLDSGYLAIQNTSACVQCGNCLGYSGLIASACPVELMITTSID